MANYTLKLVKLEPIYHNTNLDNVINDNKY
jgi:hypothetical protein